MKVVEELNKSARIVHQTFNTPSYFVAPRDFLFLSGSDVLNDGRVVITSYSIEHKDVPSTNQFQRGEIPLSGFVIEDTGSKTCKIQYFVQADIKGMY